MEVGNAYSELTGPVEQYEHVQSSAGTNPGVQGYEDHPLDLDLVHAAWDAADRRCRL